MRGPVSTITILAADLVAVQSADPADVAFVSDQHGRALESYDARPQSNPDDPVVKPSNPRDQVVRIRKPLRCNRSRH